MQHNDERNVVTLLKSDRRDDAGTFDLAPVSHWLEDYSGLKTLFDEWRRAGITDLRD